MKLMQLKNKSFKLRTAPQKHTCYPWQPLKLASLLFLFYFHLSARFKQQTMEVISVPLLGAMFVFMEKLYR